MLFAKSPISGRVKTRLARACGAGFAAEVARALLVDALGQWGPPPRGQRCLLGDAPERRDFPIDIPAGWDYRYQGEGDLGEKLVGAFEAARVAGSDGAVAIAADAPRIPKSVVLEALSICTRGEAVVAPAADGGYGLIGLPGGDFELRQIFPSSGWGGKRVLAAARIAISSQGLKLCELEATEDVDTGADLLSLAADLRDDGDLRGRLPRLAQLLANFEGKCPPATPPNCR